MSDVDGRWWDVEPESPRRDTPGMIDSAYVGLAVTSARVRQDDGLDFFRGLRWALVVGPIIWALIVAAFLL